MVQQIDLPRGPTVVKHRSFCLEGGQRRVAARFRSSAFRSAQRAIQSKEYILLLAIGIAAVCLRVGRRASGKAEIDIDGQLGGLVDC